MSLLTYKDARPWAKSIGARVESGTMPPWHADPSTGEFENDRRLTAADKDTIARWVANGAPEGDPSELPAPPHYADGWIIGQPDAVLRMQEDYAIPASGTIAYQYFEVPTSFAEDRWIQAFEVRPGNRTVVHHVIVYTRPAGAGCGAGPSRAIGTAAGAAVRLRQGHGDPGGTDRRSCVASRSAEGAGTKRSAGAEDPRSFDWRLRPGQLDTRLPVRYGRPARCRLDAGVPDALHHDRDGNDRSHEHRLHLLEDAASHRVAVHRPHQRQPPHPGGRPRLSRRRGDDDESRRHVVGHAPAHARARQAMELRRHVPRRTHGGDSGRAEIRLRVADRLSLQAVR